jgi:hypothetical protein
MPPHPFAADDPAATRRNSAVEEMGELDSKEEEDYDEHRFAAPMGRRRDSESSSSSSGSDNMGKGSSLKF